VHHKVLEEEMRLKRRRRGSRKMSKRMIKILQSKQHVNPHFFLSVVMSYSQTGSNMI
jgi:hypothetical protein